MPDDVSKVIAANFPQLSGKLQTTIRVRVRYPECDPMGVAHHGVFAVWLELARTELLRECGAAYADLEKQGVFFVVVSMSLRFRKPAHYDDVLDVFVKDVTPRGSKRGIKLLHEYEVRRAGELLATAETTLACVDKHGRVQAIPDDALGS
jgi:acyl-CoA thioester hydrolase